MYRVSNSLYSVSMVSDRATLTAVDSTANEYTDATATTTTNCERSSPDPPVTATTSQLTLRP
jgi:hypothetical protein